MNVVTKEFVMKTVALGLAHEGFEHPYIGTVDITNLRNWCKTRPDLIINLPTESFIDFVMEFRVFEEDRVKTIDDQSWKCDPGIYVECEDGSYLFVDGIHRAVRRHREGREDMRFYLVPEKEARRFPFDTNLLVDSRKMGYDWGDKIVVDGKIVERSK